MQKTLKLLFYLSCVDNSNVIFYNISNDYGKEKAAMERFVYRGTEKLRCGYTTGSCAAAAAKGAAEMLLTQHKTDLSHVTTPAGIKLRLEIHEQSFSENKASCCVIKDSGDDPDVTNGIAVFADVELAESGIVIKGGKGVGKVTKEGLDQPVGEAAINSVPRRMITEAVSEIAEMYEYSGGFIIIISVPDGEKISENTFNPRMGIVGGISIIGTTGIVEPMSNSAIIETIRTEANMRRAEGMDTLVLSVGNYSDDFIHDHVPFLEGKCVTCSNFIGDAIDIGVSMGFSNILLIGHIGKLVKLGSGIMNTHSSAADGRIETLIACGALAGTDTETLRKLTECVTADSAIDILTENNMAAPALDILIHRIGYYLEHRVKNKIPIGAVVFSFKNDILLKTDNADDIITLLRKD